MGVKRYRSSYLIEPRLSTQLFPQLQFFQEVTPDCTLQLFINYFQAKLIFSFKVGSVVQPMQPNGQRLQESFLIEDGDGPLGSACMSPPTAEAAQVAPNGDGEKTIFY